MPIIHAIVLGIVQGLAEFLPISSSGHLIVVPWLFGWNDFAHNAGLEKAFDTALHIGTVIAVVAYFWTDLWKLLVAWLRSIGHRAIRTPEERMAWLLALSCIPRPARHSRPRGGGGVAARAVGHPGSEPGGAARQFHHRPPRHRMADRP